MPKKAAKKTSAAARDQRPEKLKDSLGRALNKARRIRHLTLNELADRIGCSASALSKIENQKAAPSIGMLYRISKALRMDVTTLLQPAGTARSFITKAGRHPVYHAMGMEFSTIVPASPDHRVEATIAEIAPGAQSDEPFQHGSGELLGLVLEGKLKLTVDGNIHNVEQGDSFVFSYDRPHGFGNASTRPARVLFVFAPPVDFASRSRHDRDE
jgi:transcriptional regulator with XRE-family HTH domain